MRIVVADSALSADHVTSAVTRALAQAAPQDKTAGRRIGDLRIEVPAPRGGEDALARSLGDALRAQLGDCGR